MPDLSAQPPHRFEPVEDTLRAVVVLRDGEPEHEVDGVILEGAWRYGEEMLLATTNDIPYEDTLHLTLVGRAGVVDVVHLGGAYTTGSFRALSVEGATLTFRFFADTDWTVTVLPAPTLSLPFVGDPRGVRRAFGLRKRLAVSGQPSPER